MWRNYIKHIAAKKKVGILDLTRGELGTRGTPEIRTKEAKKAAKILGVSFREQLNMADGRFTNDDKHQLQIIEKIRQYKPEIVLCNAKVERWQAYSIIGLFYYSYSKHLVMGEWPA